MKVSKHILCVLLILPYFVLPSRAQENGQSPPPPKYRLELVYIFEPGTTGSTEYVFVIGNAGFKSVASLKEYLGKLPAGSTLEWAPGCLRIGDEPLLSSETEMEDFKAFCIGKNINFILVPAG